MCVSFEEKISRNGFVKSHESIFVSKLYKLSRFWQVRYFITSNGLSNLDVDGLLEDLDCVILRSVKDKSFAIAIYCYFRFLF